MSQCFFLHAKGLGTLEDIELLWKEMESKHIEPRITTYNSMISGVIKLAPPGEARAYAEKYFNLLRGDKNIIEYSNETYEYLLRSYVADNNLDGLLIYWDSQSNGSIHKHKTSNAWTLLFLCILQQDDLEKLELVHKYFKNMQAEGRRKNQNQRVMIILVEKEKGLRGSVDGHAQSKEKMLKALVMLKYEGWKRDIHLLVFTE